MSTTLNDNIQSNSPKSLDNKYMVDGVTPYTDVAHVNSVIALTYRSKGLTVLIGNQEYWYKDGVADTDLVLKSPSSFCTIDLHKDIILINEVSFVHTNGGVEVDNIDTNVAITRASGRAIFNPLQEAFYHYDVSPKGTKWNADGWGNLANLQDRTYLDLANCLNYNIGGAIVGAELIMWDTTNNKYYKFDFTQWTQGQSSTEATNTIDISTLPVDGTVVSIGDAPFARTFTYNSTLNQWTNLKNNSFTPLNDCINDDFEECQVYGNSGSPILTLNARVGGVSGNTIATTVTPSQVGFAFANPTMSGGTGGGGGFAYTRWLVEQSCDGTIHFDDGSTMDTAPRDFKNFILVDGVFGNDITAKPYNMLLPYKTVNKAHENAKSGDTIVLNPSPNQYILTRPLFASPVYPNPPLNLNYYINSGAILSSASNNNPLTYNRIFVNYNNLAGGVFAVNENITINGCILGFVISVDAINNRLEIASGNQVMTPTFTVGNTISNGTGVTASLVSHTKSTSPENNISITGGGSLILRGLAFNGGYGGNFTIDVADLYLTNLFNYGGASYGQVNINCNNLILSSYFYFGAVNDGTYNYGGIGLITYTNQVGGAFPRGTQISNGSGVTAYVLQDDGGGYINIYNPQGGNFSNGDTITGWTEVICTAFHYPDYPINTIWSNGLGVSATLRLDVVTFPNTMYFSDFIGGTFSVGETLTSGANSVVVGSIKTPTAQVNTSTLNTLPIDFNLNVKSIVNNTITFGIFPATVACNWNIGTYRKTTIEANMLPHIFFYGETAPQFDVISNVNFDDFLLDTSTSNYSHAIFYMATGRSLKGKYFITGYYNYTGSIVTNGGVPSLIQLNGNTIQTIDFNGVANLKNSGFINEVSNYIENWEYSRVTARGRVNIDNSQTPVYWGLIWSGILISNSKLKMYADLIYDSPINFAILLGNYTSNLTSLQVDLIDCQIVNKNQSCLLPVIGVGFVGGSAMLPPLTLPSKLPIQIKYSLGTVQDFSNGETISNGLGATGVVNGLPNGTYLFITTVVGQFNIGDTITGGTSGASATIQEVNYWGTLRLKNAVVIGNTSVQNSIEGAWLGQPHQVYTGYSNKPLLNMDNSITGTNYIVDSDINSNNF